MDVLMIHDVRKDYFDLPLDRYRLTFDDGLFSQYYYYPLLRDHAEPLTFFITTALIREAPARPRFTGRFLEYMKTGVYSFRAHIEKDLKGFMTLEEVRFLAEQPNVRLGAHSHFHDLVLTDVHPRKPKPVSPWKSARFKDVPEPLQRLLLDRERLLEPLAADLALLDEHVAQAVLEAPLGRVGHHHHAALERDGDGLLVLVVDQRQDAGLPLQPDQLEDVGQAEVADRPLQRHG